MKALMECCRSYTALTAMQCELLKRISISLPFVADLTHAQVTMFALTNKPEGQLVVLSRHNPHTALNLPELGDVGRIVSLVEEPLIQRTLETGRPFEGKREQDYGDTSIKTYTFAIHDGNDPIAAISLDVPQAWADLGGSEHVLQTAKMIIINARKALDQEMYGPIKATDGIIIADKTNRIIYANVAALHIFRVLGVGNLLGMHLFDRQLTCRITKETVVPERPYEREIEAAQLVLLERSIPIMDGGNLLRRVVILENLTEIRQKDKEIKIQSAVIQEIHHRVKNNLQTIASLLRLQARRSSSQEVKDALQESVNRILSISVVHEFLSQQGGEQIDVFKVTNNILDLVSQTMLAHDFVLERKFSGPSIVLPSKQGTNLALVINELILNAIEHAFENRSQGVIGLETRLEEETIYLDLYDDGDGLPDDFSIGKTRSLGLQIVRTLIEGDMSGSFRLVNGEKGTHAQISFPRAEDEEEVLV